MRSRRRGAQTEVGKAMQRGRRTLSRRSPPSRVGCGGMDCEMAGGGRPQGVHVGRRAHAAAELQIIQGEEMSAAHKHSAQARGAAWWTLTQTGPRQGAVLNPCLYRCWGGIQYSMDSMNGAQRATAAQHATQRNTKATQMDTHSFRAGKQRSMAQKQRSVDQISNNTERGSRSVSDTSITMQGARQHHVRVQNGRRSTSCRTSCTRQSPRGAGRCGTRSTCQSRCRCTGSRR